ncbi:MAG: hypothetical protein V9G29_00940 [Burkholderiaceae bacterium]
MFDELAENVGTAPPMRPTPLTQDELLGLFSGDIGRPRRGARAGNAVRHVRQDREQEADARSRLRRSLSRPRTHVRDHPDRCSQLGERHAAHRAGCLVDDAGGRRHGMPRRWRSIAGRGASRPASREVLDQYATDYPKDPKAGPHDQPQSMCPAFGSLRVGLRMRRTATILSGSACCVYGLTFTSHFYGAKRSVGYVPFNS